MMNQQRRRVPSRGKDSVADLQIFNDLEYSGEPEHIINAIFDVLPSLLSKFPRSQFTEGHISN